MVSIEFFGTLKWNSRQKTKVGRFPILIIYCIKLVSGKAFNVCDLFSFGRGDTMDDDQDENSTTMQIEENFLRSCRNGDLGTVKQFLAYRDAGKVDFNLNCKGQTKYLGWTSLHLATYFGHIDVVECLLAHNINVNAINENGDTALHKAAFIGRVVSIVHSLHPALFSPL